MTSSWLPPDEVLPGEREPGGVAVASGETLDVPGRGRLVGRRPERERIDRLLQAARAGEAGSLLVVGDPGVGKTALLEAASARAEGFSTLVVRGLESEAPLAHACLLELLTPLRHLLGDIPIGHAQALAGALGWGQ